MLRAWGDRWPLLPAAACFLAAGIVGHVWGGHADWWVSWSMLLAAAAGGVAGYALFGRKG